MIQFGSQYKMPNPFKNQVSVPTKNDKREDSPKKSNDLVTQFTPIDGQDSPRKRQRSKR